MDSESRPEINKELDAKTFKNYYYLKTELVAFCRKEGLQDKSLRDAIQCWNYKKSQLGHNRYEETDLIALKKG